MASDGLRQLFVHELNYARNLEISGNHMLEDLSVQVFRPELVRLMGEGAEGSREQLENLSACYGATGISTGRRIGDPVVEGLRERFHAFTATQPSPDALDMFVLGTCLRVILLGEASYQELAEMAEMLGELECVRRLRMNLTNKEEYACRLRRLGYDLGYQFAGDGALIGGG
jgi:ferritin-like metal-binding protein YciE